MEDKHLDLCLWLLIFYDIICWCHTKKDYSLLLWFNTSLWIFNERQRLSGGGKRNSNVWSHSYRCLILDTIWKHACKYSEVLRGNLMSLCRKIILAKDVHDVSCLNKLSKQKGKEGSLICAALFTWHKSNCFSQEKARTVAPTVWCFIELEVYTVIIVLLWLLA